MVATKGKTKAVLNHLQAKGSITSIEAINLFGATRLSAIIFNLRKAGYMIISVPQKGVDRYGTKMQYAKYTLISPKTERKS